MEQPFKTVVLYLCARIFDVSLLSPDS